MHRVAFLILVTSTLMWRAFACGPDASLNYIVEETDRYWSESPLMIVPMDIGVWSAEPQWIAQDSGTNGSFYGVDGDGALLVAVGVDGMIRTSTNGVSWSAVDSGVSDLLINVRAVGGQWVVVGDTGRILTSTDGVEWVSQTTPTTVLLRGIAYGDGVYIACGGDGTILRSTNAVDWVSVASGTTVVLQGVDYGDGQFVVVGAGGTILTSPDGQAWTARTSETGNWLLDVTYAQDGYVAIGLGGVMRVSADGHSWSIATSGTTEHLYRVRFGDGRFIATGENGTLITSTTGGVWTSESSGVSDILRGVAAFGSEFVAVGFNGRILLRSEVEVDPGDGDTQLPGDLEVPAAQPQGALSDIVVFTSAGHGFTYIEANNNWRTQRPLLHTMVEDMGNLDQMNVFADYVFRAGGTVVPFRPLGYQTNEVVLDNVDAGVTFNGTWLDSVSPIYYGNSGELPYRYAYIDPEETTAWAVYRPNLPESGFYPVYAWTRHGSDRVRQLYRVQHSGGVTEVRVNHRRVGNGWVWLGTYHFESGTSGSVTISNYAPGENPATRIVIADAIRFGNGMGDVARGSAGISGFERELEASRYWVQRMVGQGMSSALYDNPSFTDWNDNIGAPPRMAAEMNRQADGSFWDRIYVGFHSNASGGGATARGPMGLWDTRGTTLKQDRQKDFGRLMANHIHADMTWASANGMFLDTYANNTANLYGSGYGEIFGAMNDQMNSTIIETLFHDNATDANLLRDPVARRVMARSCYEAIVHHLSTNNAAVPKIYVPNPPVALSVVNSGMGQLTLRWTPPPATPIAGDSPSGYVIYRSPNGYGFGNPVTVAGGSTTQVTLTDLPVGETIYFQIAAVNAGGESLPSTVVGARVSPEGRARHLIVNGFERNDRNQAPVRYFAHGLNGNVTLVRQRRINSFDYVVQHGEALAAAGHYFDSGDNTALLANDLNLLDYFGVIWFLGRESTRDQTFNAVEQARVAEFLDQGGRLFLSGANISFDLDQTGSTADKEFAHDYLTLAFAASDSGQFSARSTTGTFWDGLSTLAFDDGSGPTYRVAFSDVYTTRNGSVPVLYYGASGTQIAGISYTGVWRSVVLGFPFETILSVDARNEMMGRVVNPFFGADPWAVGLTTASTPVPVPLHWLRTFFGDVDDYEALALEEAASGMQVWRAYVAGTDPTDPESRFAFHPATRAEPGVGHILVWEGTDEPNRYYNIHWTTNLLSPMQPLATNLMSQHPDTNIHTNIPPHNSGTAYYKLEVILREGE